LQQPSFLVAAAATGHLYDQLFCYYCLKIWKLRSEAFVFSDLRNDHKIKADHPLHYRGFLFKLFEAQSEWVLVGVQ
jgi:hypothetical protein